MEQKDKRQQKQGGKGQLAVRKKVTAQVVKHWKKLLRGVCKVQLKVFKV